MIQVKGIGTGTVENLNANGISTISDLLAADPEELSANINGASPKTVSEW
ncbi:MAG: helix-hairpin-helix domain-containing protein [Candidatus Lokiarchaeota archaeon]|nr:helix-hairpin-helix domain-containing protein [Candidatus Lokiarchaeota archaeon]